MASALPASPPLPTLHVCGPDAATRQRIRSLLRDAGYSPDELADGVSGPDTAIVVVCPPASDSDGVQTLAAILEQDATPEHTGYVFVLPGAVTRLRMALDALRGRRYVALLHGPTTREALARQVALAARWLGARPPRVMLGPFEAHLAAPLS